MLERAGLAYWERSLLARALRAERGFAAPMTPQRRRWEIRRFAEKFDFLRERELGRRRPVPPRARFRGNREHLALLVRSASTPIKMDSEWNRWRRRSREQPDLQGAHLAGYHLDQLNLEGVRLDDANLSWTDMRSARLAGASLKRTLLLGARLDEAHLEGTQLDEAWLQNCSMSEARMRWAQLPGAAIMNCNLNRADLRDCDLRGALVWGNATWGIETRGAQQEGLLMGTNGFDPLHRYAAGSAELEDLRARDRPPLARRVIEAARDWQAIEIGDLATADFVAAIENNRANMARVLTSASRKLVLMLGRFTGRQRQVLRTIEDSLKGLGFLPMIFDFEVGGRDLAGTLLALAAMSRFVIADLTDPRSVAMECQLIIPNVRVPFVPLIRTGREIFAMFQSLADRFAWVLPPVTYQDPETLEERIEEWVIQPSAQLADELERRRIRPGPTRL